ncbi:ABC transporter permease [Paenibacillus motobuensis]|uniref:ABC transporter permease n=1 Tax=Paenibacillus TaxID=44249 RepID=UPI0020421D2F|nr:MULTISPECIES: ABC transporter permease [Paenibacillus]MCM3039764.1 ABC transporter permease [Paenibacillus lutimineralis]MCM3646868.1 ABC transporter permease [Paenibacillus motobuensis]
MTLFSIARKNIRKNFTNYFLYFASMIFSIVIYFTFVSLKYDTTIQSASDGSPKISSAFSGASVVLMIFVAIFIWYSNSFFTRKRKKEVGLYSLLGVRKKQIGRMLFYENFLMGILALVIGIALGSVLSQFFVMILMKVMGYELLSQFSISLSAVTNTVIVFMIITLITSFQGYRLIYRFKLIELFRADQEHEREPKVSWITALISLILIGTGYWLAMQNLLQSKVWATLGYMMTPLVILLTVILGTYFLFSTLTVALLKLSRTRKKSYWKGMNMIGTSQLLYRIKGNARTLTIIAVLSATTLTAVGTSYSFYYNNRTNAELANPNSMMFISTDDGSVRKVEDLIANSADHKLRYHQSVPVLEMNADVSGLESVFYDGEMAFTILSEHDFNQLADAQSRDEKLSLQGNEAVVLDPSYMEGMSPEYVGKTITLKDKQQKQQVTFKAMHKYNVLNQRAVYITIVVSDEIFGKLQSKAISNTLEVYSITGQDKAKTLTADMNKILPDEAKFSSFYDTYSKGMEAFGLMMFMGGFLGLVFLAATGSIIYFKQLTEASADKGRYLILHKIGVNKKEIRKTVAKQVGFIFALPLIAGIAHCAVALSALSNLMHTNLAIPVVICMGVYTCIYLIYYALTVNAYYRIVTNVK